MRRLLAALVLCAGLAMAAPVYMTAHGKTYHTDRRCMALARSQNVLVADDAAARAHGLRECAICQHRHKAAEPTGKPGKQDNGSFGARAE